ncbi:MAG TPA: acetyl-CoA carboxylase biotin carboxyl carrier protein [Thermoanaerobaculia bacterium]|nr:acetyl-CoA carboxylase biotin carboxyl carrier protein [Thermoanaerobaculia bacterium]
MNFKEILELIDRVAERGIAGIEIEQAGTKIRIEGRASQPHVIHSYVGEMRPESPMLPPAMPVGGVALPAATLVPQGAPAAPAEEPEEGLHIITSPIVGTFYRAPNPEAEAFVNVGDRVSKGQVLCIIEAMKLMNEIESDVDGVIVKIYPQNAQPIEFGEKLFAVRI